MGPSSPTVSVVIASYREDPGPLAEVVSRYLRQGADEVVVVLDGPQPASRAVLATLRDARLVVDELGHNVGQALAKLHGVRTATSRIVLTADDDILVADGVVARQRRLHDGRTDLVVVGYIPVSGQRGSRHDVSARIFDAEYRAVTDRWEREPETILQGMYGGLVSVSRALFLRADAFKPTVPLAYYEDLDLGLRLAAVGGSGRFDTATAGEHLHHRSITGFAAESRIRRRALAALQERWSTVPAYTRVPDTALEHRVRRLYERASAVPGIGVAAERASLWSVRAAARARWARGEELGARVLRGVLEAAEQTGVDTAAVRP